MPVVDPNERSDITMIVFYSHGWIPYSYPWYILYMVSKMQSMGYICILILEHSDKVTHVDLFALTIFIYVFNSFP